MPDRIPPQNIECEQSIIGSVLQNRQALQTAIELLKPTDFYLPKHAKIWTAIMKVHGKGGAVDLLTVPDALITQGQLDDVGGRRYLMDLTDSVVNFADIEHHVRLVLKASAKNQTINNCSRIIEFCYNPENSKDDVVAEVQQFALQQTSGDRRIKIWQPKELAAEFMESLGQSQLGLPTGFPRLDSMMLGMQNGYSIIVGGWTSVGKTSFCLNVCRNLAVYHSVPSLFISLEMSRHQLMNRFICAMADVSSYKLRRHDFEEVEIQAVNLSAGRYSESKLYVADPSTISSERLAILIRRAILEFGIKAVFIDYLQLIQAKAENERLRVTKISGLLKALPLEFDIPFISVCKLARAHENRRPQLSDLKESGDLEYDADQVIFVHRERDPKGILQNEAEIILAKARNEKTGIVEVLFNPKRTAFYEVEQRYDERE